MTIWDRAAAALAEDVNLGCDAVYRPSGSTTDTALRVVLSMPDQMLTGLGGTAFQSATDQLMVPQGAMPGRPGRGDTFTIGGVALAVLDVMADEAAAAWRVTCDR